MIDGLAGPPGLGRYRAACPAVDHPHGPLVTGEWHVAGEPIGDKREQYVVQNGLAPRPGTRRGGEDREVRDEDSAGPTVRAAARQRATE
ncbi:hypothetical protein ACFYL6_29115 [Micromonospora sp. NPDC007208]|uniref:hypothetical protein n=1 Tax=Micromonospora sp. NPDC007208 TaxID=3364236 RepID=UPI0036ABC8C2